ASGGGAAGGDRHGRGVGSTGAGCAGRGRTGRVADGGRMIAPADMAACRAAIRTGSLSFHAASRVLPARVRDPALALYAFCRVADDEVDEGADKAGAVLRLRDRLELVYQGRPRNGYADRAF